MRAGQLRHRVTLQALTPGQDAYGAPGTVWADVSTVSAEILDITGKEFLAAAATQNSVTTKIRIRYRAGVLPAMRAVELVAGLPGPVYNIDAVLDKDGRRRELLLMCSRGVVNG